MNPPLMLLNSLHLTPAVAYCLAIPGDMRCCGAGPVKEKPGWFKRGTTALKAVANFGKGTIIN